MVLDNETVDDLINEFRSLHVRQSEVLERIRRARQQETVTTVAEARRLGSDAPLQARFPIGALIVILSRSRVRRPVERIGDASFDLAAERFGTVSGHNTQRGRVHFITRNGTDTWRVSTSIRLAYEHET